jgi:hypothetical protein
LRLSGVAGGMERLTVWAFLLLGARLTGLAYEAR